MTMAMAGFLPCAWMHRVGGRGVPVKKVGVGGRTRLGPIRATESDKASRVDEGAGLVRSLAGFRGIRASGTVECGGSWKVLVISVVKDMSCASCGGISSYTFVCFFFDLFFIPTMFALFGSLFSVLIIPILIVVVLCSITFLYITVSGLFKLGAAVWKFRNSGSSLVKFQVGLMGRIDNLEVEVTQLLSGFSAPPHQVLRDAVVALLRYSDSFIAADFSISTHRDEEKIEEKFVYYSLEERGSRDESWDEWRARGLEEEDGRVKHVVVTLVVVAKGIRKLPVMNEAKDIEENLKQLGCIKSEDIQKVEVVCTPFSDQFKMAVKYPRLKYY